MCVTRATREGRQFPPTFEPSSVSPYGTGDDTCRDPSTARRLADVAGSDEVAPEHVAEAVRFRVLDRVE